ncbi:unnamed protein product [Durusdinium trenchii]|uniref:Deacetylase sirtuin-type domain-containing protein n=1 Tax=Durusdinium trenchii TaxID=1381693 RepID=A0ABP0PXF8_9DINO
MGRASRILRTGADATSDPKRPRRQGSSLHGLALGQLGGCCCYFDGRIEALEVAAIRLCPEGSKLRWELFEPDGNAEKLPKGLAPFSSPMHAAADFISAGCALAFTGAGISKESGVPTYRDGDGLWKRYDAMEASQISRTVWKPLGNPPNVMEFPGIEAVGEEQLRRSRAILREALYLALSRLASEASFYVQLRWEELYSHLLLRSSCFLVALFVVHQQKNSLSR